MIVIVIILVITIIAFLLNEFYFHVVLSYTQELQILKGKNGKNYDWIAFGSSYCRFGLTSTPDEDEVGFNFGVAAQFLYYSDKMLREYAETCLKKNGIVFLIIADLVFAEVGRGLYGADRYQLLLNKLSLGNGDRYRSFLQEGKYLYTLCMLHGRCGRHSHGRQPKGIKSFYIPPWKRQPVH